MLLSNTPKIFRTDYILLHPPSKDSTQSLITIVSAQKLLSLITPLPEAVTQMVQE